MILIRADGNARIGAGHLMRCLTIAERIDRSRDQVLFVCADADSAAFASERGERAHVLGTDGSRPEAELEKKDTGWRALVDRLHQSGQTNRLTVLVDSYYATNTYLEKLKDFGRVFLLDDMGDRVCPVDGLINYNLYAEESMYEGKGKEGAARYYLGGAYIPIRQQFLEARWTLRRKAENILITTGGGDVENIAGRILEKIWRPGLRFHLVSGGFNPHGTELEQQAKKLGNVQIYRNVRDMAELMARCDLAVTAGGTTVYELCAVGVPIVCFSYAENQEKLARYIGNSGIGGYGGMYHRDPEGTLEQITKQVQNLCEVEALRKRYSDNAGQLVDGRGAARIAAVLQA